MSVKFVGACVGLTLLISGCADLSFFKSPDMKGDTVGLKSYYAKPYILVARDGTAKVTGVSLVFLPDLENPVYARARSGYGSANLTLAFSNGIITNFGQQTDTKVPETLTALGGLDTSIATALKTRTDAALERHASDFGKYSDQLVAIGKDLYQLSANDKVHAFSTSMRGTIVSVAAILIGSSPNAVGGLAQEFKKPGAAASADKLTSDLKGAATELSALKAPTDQLPEQAKMAWASLTEYQGELNKIVSDLQPKAADPPALTLYEVQMRDGKTVLKEVPFGSHDQ